MIALVAATVLLPIIFYGIPGFLSFFLDASQTRFTGFLFDPNYFASFQILPAFILLWIAIEKPFSKKIGWSVISFFLFILSVGSIVWSGSRGGMAGFIVGIIVMIGCFFWKYSWKKATCVALITVVGCLIAIVIIPSVGKEQIHARIQSIIVKNNPDEHPSVIPFSARQGRGAIWKSAYYEIIKNPLGYGPDYGPTADIVGVNNDHHRVAHNTLLQILLTGGFGLLIVILIGGYWLGKKFFLSDCPLSELHYLFSALVGIIAAGVFLDSLWSRWVWVTIALILVYLHHEQTQKVA